MKQKNLFTNKYGFYSENDFWKKIYKKMHFQTILFPYKKCVTEKRIEVNNPFILMVLLSIPFIKLPWLLPLANLIIGIENQILADLEKYIVHTWMEKQIGLLLSDHRYCIHRYIKYTLRYSGYSRFPYIWRHSSVQNCYVDQVDTWQKNTKLFHT